MLCPDVLCSISGLLCSSGHPQTALDLLLVCKDSHASLLHTREPAKRRCRFLEARRMVAPHAAALPARKKQHQYWTEYVVLKGRTMVFVEVNFCKAFGNRYIFACENVSVLPRITSIERLYGNDYFVYSDMSTTHCSIGGYAPRKILYVVAPLNKRAASRLPKRGRLRHAFCTLSVAFGILLNAYARRRSAKAT